MQATVVATKRERTPLNGVDTPTLFATINAVKGMPELAKFQFRASNRWLKGTHSRTVIESFSGTGGAHSHAVPFQYDADHPAVLVGKDEGPDRRAVALAVCRFDVLTNGVPVEIAVDTP
jgi:hypothetical protein